MKTDKTMSDQKMGFSRSFSRMERRIYGVIGWLIIAFVISTIFKPYFDPLSSYHQHISQVVSAAVAFGKSFHRLDHFQSAEAAINPTVRNLSNARSDVYEITGDVRIHRRSSTIFVDSPINGGASLSLKPYPRKTDYRAMNRVATLTIKHAEVLSSDAKNNGSTSIPMPSCDGLPPHITARTPAVVFSMRGYAGNHYHAFADVLLPLYCTAAQFGRDVLFLVLDGFPARAQKYRNILDRLTKHDIVFFHEGENQDHVLCFSRVIIGLRANLELRTDDDRSMPEFARFVRSAYSLTRGAVVKSPSRPRMLLIRRGGGRRIMNWSAVVGVAQRLGFEVAARDVGEDVVGAARLVNGFDAMVGVHGAGLTNMVFLPAGAVLIQVVPYGLHLMAPVYEAPAWSMKLRYLGYQAGLNESLLPEAGANITDPLAVFSQQGWAAFKGLYMDHQDLRLDLGRFSQTLFKAWELLHV